MNILVIDIGGSHVKVLATGQNAERKFESGPKLSAQQMVDGVKQITGDWAHDVISIGYPGPVVHGRIVSEPVNLGTGWVGFDFPLSFGKPVKIVNDAAMQALGSYEGGKMLFLGLGTGLGSALVIDGNVEPMELAHLPYRKATYEDYIGERGLERLGRKKWKRRVFEVVEQLQAALQADYVVLGGGNVRKLDELPPGSRLGKNENAFVGGFRLWAVPPAIESGPHPAVAGGHTVPDRETATAQEHAIAAATKTNGDESGS